MYMMCMILSYRSFPAFQALQDAFDGWKEALRVPRLESKPREAERGLHGPAPGGRDVLFEAFRRRFSPIFTDFHRFFNDFAWFLLGFVDVSCVFQGAALALAHALALPSALEELDLRDNRLGLQDALSLAMH